MRGWVGGKEAEGATSPGALGTLPPSSSRVGHPHRGQARWAPAQVLVARGVRGGATESGGKGSGSQGQSQKTLHVWGTRALGLKTNSVTGRAS